LAIDGVLDGWMRHEAAAAHARLIHRFGWSRAPLAEDALQEALVRAVETWPFSGLPNRPGAWLFTVAANRMLDALRAAAERRGQPLPEGDDLVARDEPDADDGDLPDPELHVLFALCHPALDARSAIAVALQVLCGFTLREIASALLTSPDAVAQRLARAKRALRAVPGIADFPAGNLRQERLATALDVVALMFNEGFEPSAGERPMRPELCAEGLRLADALARHPLTRSPASSALAALLNLLSARLPARLAVPDAVTLLPEQDRRAWSQPHLRRGLELLAASAEGDRPTRYHLLAGIAATHAVAASATETDWAAVVVGYHRLLALEDSPVHRLNLAVALQRAGDVVGAEAVVEPLADEPSLARYFWLHAVLADVRTAAARPDDAHAALTTAMALAATPGQTRWVEERLAVLPNRSEP
jgi:RNA polymerase sigma-70 factor (ECF subfamily)